MPPKRQRPKLDGAERAMFDVLVAMHARYLAGRHLCFTMAAESGISRARIHEIARLALIYASPPGMDDLVDRTIAVIEQQAATEGQKPS